MWATFTGLVSRDSLTTANDTTTDVDNVNESYDHDDDWIVVNVKDSTNLGLRASDSISKKPLCADEKSPDRSSCVLLVESSTKGHREPENDEHLLLDFEDSVSDNLRIRHNAAEKGPPTLTLGHFIRPDSHLPCDGFQRVQRHDNQNQLNRTNLSREPKKQRQRKNKMKQLSGMNNDRKCQ